MATNNAINNMVAGVGVQVTDYTAGTLLTTKGDLLIGNGVNSATRLPVGTNGDMLIADSAQATGVRYDATQPAVLQVSRAFGYGNALTNYVIPVNVSIGVASAPAMVANTLYCFPFSITVSKTFSLIGIRVNAISANTVRLGIYDATGTGGYPGARVLDAGTISTASTGEKTVAISQLLSGNYWMVMISSGTPNINGGSGTTSAENVIGGNSNNPTALFVSLTEAAVGSYFTALPASLASDTFTYNTTASFMIFLQV